MISILNYMDYFRGRVLRLLLPLPFSKKIFNTRSLRVCIIFNLFSGIQFLIALSIPLWSLILSPLAFGVPHLYASFRYTSKSIINGNKKYINILFILFLVATGIRLIVHYLKLGEVYSVLNTLVVESFFCFLMTLSFLFLKKIKKNFLGIILFLGLTVSFSFFPWFFATIIALSHNYISFIFWKKYCRCQKDKLVFYISFTCTILLSILILSGYFDNILVNSFSLFSFFSEDISTKAFNSIFYGLKQPEFIVKRLLAIFTWTQSLHYLVWLKIIPELDENSQAPLPFKKSYLLLVSDIGKKITIFSIIISISSLLIWVLLEFKEARYFYILFASFHGFFEILGIVTNLGNR